MFINPFGPLINITTRMPRPPATSLHSKRFPILRSHRFERWISMAHQRLSDHLQTMSEMAIDGRHSPAMWDNFVEGRRATLFQAIPGVVESPSIARQLVEFDKVLARYLRAVYLMVSRY